MGINKNGKIAYFLNHPQDICELAEFNSLNEVYMFADDGCTEDKTCAC